MQFKKVDGAQGEGGGQVLRTSLSLAILTGQAIEITNIRANRNKPGLLRQHLTAVLAAQKICDARVEGAELGADTLRFIPNKVKAGEYHFAIGTAGSTTLVCQTVLPVLALADGPSTVTFEGGTHNGLSPSLCFFQQAYLPLLKAMGIACEVNINQLGFYPAGGGKWQLTIIPSAQFKPLHLTTPVQANDDNMCFKALISRLPNSIATREITKAKALLNKPLANQAIQQVHAPCAGNTLQISLAQPTHAIVFEQVAQKGLSAERIAQMCVTRASAFLNANVAVDDYLADQLLLPLALAGAGSFTTTQLSLHTRTNIAVIAQLFNKAFNVEQLSTHQWRVSLT